jgi:hypothetical protein
VDLVDEQHTWDDLGATLLSPLGNFLINLLADLRLDFANISRKQCHEALRAAVDDIDLVKRDGMNDLLALLQLTLGALDVACLRARVVEVGRARERPAEF